MKKHDLKEKENQTDFSELNWFERMPKHWQFIYYLVGGIVIGLLLRFIF